MSAMTTTGINHPAKLYSNQMLYILVKHPSIECSEI